MIVKILNKKIFIIQRLNQTKCYNYYNLKVEMNCDKLLKPKCQNTTICLYQLQFKSVVVVVVFFLLGVKSSEKYKIKKFKYL